MIRFSDLKERRLSDLTVLFEKDKYLAHLSNRKEAETLTEHIKLVERYLSKIIEYNDLESVIDKLIKNYTSSFSSLKIDGFIKELFYKTIIYHDFGKINHLFQYDKMRNLNKRIKQRSHKEGSNHSLLGAYIYLFHQFAESEKLELDDFEQTLLDFTTTCFAFPIYKHHSGKLAIIDSLKNFSQDRTCPLKDYLKEFDFEIADEDIDVYNDLVTDMETSFSQMNEFDKDFDFFSLFALLKLNYSLLTATDYLATSEYMNGTEIKTKDDFGLLTSDFKTRLIENFDHNEVAPWNGELFRDSEQFTKKSVDTIREQNNKNLNFLRQKLGAEVLKNIEQHAAKKVFYIEAPTGGGKTNMSMIAIRKILELHPEINKVFYVFPFTTLITQTAKAIKQTFQLEDYEIAQIHSKAGFQHKKYGDEVDASYGKEKRNQIDNLFVNYLFTLMTHIKFFDILKSNRKDTNYLLHRLANSVVIIDELQAYNPDHWDKIKFFIAQYAELFNIRFVIMSATLPKIDAINLSSYSTPIPFEPLIPDAKKYLQNPNFAERVAIKTDILEKTIKMPNLANIVFEKSENYAKTRTDKYHGSVYTIIEFIFKRSAGEFYEKVKQKEPFFDHILVLSGTILEPRRKYIIEFLKDERNRKKKILLITTQVVEAGVDIDMDLGFKNQSILDSDEQLAGRINRNVNKENCELYLFKYDRPKSIYGKDWRYDVTEKNISNDEIKDILTKKEFEELYNKVFIEISNYNDSPIEMGTFSEYLNNFRRIDFNGIHNDFKLIDSENANIFVPLDVDIQCYKTFDSKGETVIENNFSDSEIKFIKKNDCLNEKGQVSGESIWNLYNIYVTDTIKKFSIEVKILNGIMSKFVFSVYMQKIDELYDFIENPPTNEENRFQQYFKLNKDRYTEIYSPEGGINEVKLKDITGQTYDFI